MRFDHHGQRDKHVRYDRSLAPLPGWQAQDVALFATEPLAPRVHVSDHFGVCATFVRSTSHDGGVVDGRSGAGD